MGVCRPDVDVSSMTGKAESDGFFASCNVTDPASLLSIGIDDIRDTVMAMKSVGKGDMGDGCDGMRSTCENLLGDATTTKPSVVDADLAIHTVVSRPSLLRGVPAGADTTRDTALAMSLGETGMTGIPDARESAEVRDISATSAGVRRTLPASAGCACADMCRTREGAETSTGEAGATTFAGDRPCAVNGAGGKTRRCC